MLILKDISYSQPHLIGTWLIRNSGSDQDFSPDNHCYDRQVASLSVITMAYQVRNLDHFLNSQLTRFRLSGVDCIKACIHCTQVPETSFDLLFLEQMTQLLCIGVPETSSRNFCSVCRPLHLICRKWYGIYWCYIYMYIVGYIHVKLMAKV